MSRLEVPLQQRTLRATGDTVLWADLVLSLKTSRGAWEQIPFRVDSGTEMTTMPAYDAKSLDLPIPKKPVPRLVLYGQEVRSGLLRRGSSVWTRPNSSSPATSWATRTFRRPLKRGTSWD